MDNYRQVEELRAALEALVECFEPLEDSYSIEVEVMDEDGNVVIDNGVVNETTANAIANAEKLLYFDEELFGDGEDQ